MEQILKSRTKAISELEEKILLLEQSMSPELELSSNNVDMDVMNENMVQLHKLYGEKCVENEKNKRQMEQQEDMIGAARGEFMVLKQKYEEIQSEKSVVGQPVRSVETENEVKELRLKAQELETHFRREKELEYVNEELRREVERLENERKRIRASQSHQVDGQVQLLEDAIGKKDQEIIKLRQSNHLLQTNIDELTF